MDKESKAYQAGQRGEIFLGNTYAELLAHEQGENSRSGRGGAPIFLLAVMGVLMACLWPLVAAGTLLFAGIGSWLLERVYPAHGGVAELLVVVVAGGLGLYGTLKVERLLQRARLYRVLRRVVRLMLLGALFVYVALNLGHSALNPLYVPDHITPGWVDSQLSPRAYVTIFILLIFSHVVSKRLDLQVEIWTKARKILRASPGASDEDVEALASELAEQSREAARARWARRRKWGGIFGAVGAIFLASIGEPAGSVVFGFFFFGLIGALLSRFLARKRNKEPKAPSPA